MVFATSLVGFLFLCYCRYFHEAYSNASLLWLNLGNSQVSTYRTIGPTLVSFSSLASEIETHFKVSVLSLRY